MEFRQLARIHTLIQEAIQHILALGHLEEFALLPVFIEADSVVLQNPTTRSAKLLLLSAANQRITKAEKRTVFWMLSDRNISIGEMSHLVRIRLICAELLGLINQGLEEARHR